jgi:hypothetical protein
LCHSPAEKNFVRAPGRGFARVVALFFSLRTWRRRQPLDRYSLDGEVLLAVD